MEITCSVDGESLSRFIDDELPYSQRSAIEAHISTCPMCQPRIGRFRRTDTILARVRVARRQAGRLVASLSVAAALVASIAANLLLTPKAEAAARPGPRLSAAPSQTLTSFYEKVAPPRARP